MYDYSGSTGFVPVNSPKMRKSRSGSLAGGRGYGADFATRMMARAEMEKGGRQIDEYFGQGKERRFEYPDTPAPPMINQRNGTMNFGGNIEGVDGRLSSSGERKHGCSNGNGTDSELEIIAVKKVKKTKTCQVNSKTTHIPQPARTNTTLETPGSKLKTPEPRLEKRLGRVKAPTPKSTSPKTLRWPIHVSELGDGLLKIVLRSIVQTRYQTESILKLRHLIKNVLRHMNSSNLGYR